MVDAMPYCWPTMSKTKLDELKDCWVPFEKRMPPCTRTKFLIWEKTVKEAFILPGDVIHDRVRLKATHPDMGSSDFTHWMWIVEP